MFHVVFDHLFKRNSRIKENKLYFYLLVILFVTVCWTTFCNFSFIYLLCMLSSGITRLLHFPLRIGHFQEKRDNVFWILLRSLLFHIVVDFIFCIALIYDIINLVIWVIVMLLNLYYVTKRFFSNTQSLFYYL